MHSQKLNISETLLSNYSNNLSKQLHRKKLLYNEAFYTNRTKNQKSAVRKVFSSNLCTNVMIPVASIASNDTSG